MPGTTKIHTKDSKDPYQRCQNFISEIPNKYTARTPKQNISRTPKQQHIKDSKDLYLHTDRAPTLLYHILTSYYFVRSDRTLRFMLGTPKIYTRNSKDSNQRYQEFILGMSKIHKRDAKQISKNSPNPASSHPNQLLFVRSDQEHQNNTPKTLKIHAWNSKDSY
ncbi:16523_t:CDS:2 [Dentiscutata erythropus]|uniref:16523_t:CDS:1 n=1 Tax=Dentiscutata erythropus TaxID=1348616 RepID=A0A9N9IZ20_9GLOM|nr:16523_t:CDS:2 [Dentiscutata erythropus]